MAQTAQSTGPIAIKRPNIEVIVLEIIGDSPLIINKFSAKAKNQMMATQEAGATSKTRKAREPKDFDGLAHDARHISTDGWDGIHAGAFRNAAISACRAAGFVMTKAKLAIFIEPDGFDRDDMTPLVRIHAGEPETVVSPCRNASGVIDLRPRPTYFPWSANLTVKFDADILSREDIVNLFYRVGFQVGIGEGRPDSKQSAGTGNGLFHIGG